MSPHIHAKVLIAGGSVAGLTLANILEQIGIDFLVLEKYDEIAPDLGASIAIFPNGFRILDQLGCYDDIKSLVGDSDAFKFMVSGNEHGKTIMDIPDASQHFIKRYVEQVKENLMNTRSHRKEWVIRPFS
jgi:2-polyprenyl-6-methoxyphenol hydroxylase-like FAD-dependent oxidoreductase